MSRTRRRAKLLPDLLGTRSALSVGGPDIVSSTEHDGYEGPVAPPAVPITATRPDAALNGQHALFEKGAATALAFRPSSWSYEAARESEGSRLDPGSVSTKEAEAARAPSSTGLLEETANAAMPTPVAGDGRTVENRAAQQALTASLAEIIHSILCARQFAIRGAHESFRKRPSTPTPPVDQLATAENLASALREELARTKVDPDAGARLTRPLIDLVLGYIGLGEGAVDVVSSDPVRDQPKLR